ncbi:Trehalose-6-P synthase/phosphatase complex synthase subunit [Physocladia obscura]|uniref:alpha,alpha-trehalose-phosphate synthase (UDP-forming) n=1 Tax=Physocladia obscura TaxID=109957 RepID=A0AAD5XIM3_9FUNG|nr:Trehalose-6-P synthase/phosphatase complex synthase subunit [Physocladia obscura]
MVASGDVQQRGRSSPRANTNTERSEKYASNTRTRESTGKASEERENVEKGNGRLLLVSNRLPITVTPTPNGDFDFVASSGGLVAGISGLAARMPFVWAGWPGIPVTQNSQSHVQEKLMNLHSAIPVFLPDVLVRDYYQGFCNRILWPLFHYHPSELSFNAKHWKAYQTANNLFADALLPHIQPGDIIWIHDFHLMILPALLKEKLSKSMSPEKLETIRIGFFLHTPFPSSEVYRILPARKDILRGLLEADCIGFQTYDYARHFMSSCARQLILGLHCYPDGVEYEGRKVKVGTYPIGIDPEKFRTGLQTLSVQLEISRLRTRFPNTKIIIGIDRLDYIKALPQKLHAFSHMLATHPEFQNGKCVMIQVAVPTRQDVLEYQNLDRVVNQLVGQVNGQFGTVEFVPVHYVHQSVSFAELVALYAVADVCVVSSTRDGMNLVSYEFIASQQGQHGVLVLSEFAGAAQSLNGAIIVNPWNTEDLSNGMYEALTMPAKQKQANFAKLDRYVSKYTSERWGTTFVNELRSLPNSFDGKRLVKLEASECMVKFSMSTKKKVFFIDYDGTLKSNHALPEFANPSKTTRELIRRLVSLPNTYVYIFSGRSRAYLDSWFADVGVGLSAEHGCFYRHPPNRIDESLIDALDGEGVISPISGSPVVSNMTLQTSLSLSSLPLLGESSIPVVAAPLATRSLKNIPALIPSPIQFNSPLLRHVSPFKIPGNSSSLSPKMGAGGSVGSGSGGIMRPPRRMQRGWFALVDQEQGDGFDARGWSEEIRPLFQYYTERTPGSFVEEKEVNLTWHYRNADPEFGIWQAAELHVNLEQILSHLAVSVILGNKTVEVRPSMVDKSTAARSVIHDLGQIGELVDFACCIGDGKTDEVLFQYLNETFSDENQQSVTCTVGKKLTNAKFYLGTVRDVEIFLEEFIILASIGTAGNNVSASGESGGSDEGIVVTSVKTNGNEAN